MNQRIENTFARLKKSGRRALIPFLMAGYPDKETSSRLLCQLPKHGADLVEMGIPFSDPAADGGEIRNAGREALALNFSIRSVPEMIAKFRAANPDTPLILMGYYNPVFHYGLKHFARDIRRAGADGMILVDLPPEEDADLRAAFGEELFLVRLITPTTDPQRLTLISSHARGFLYYVTITGITGTTAAEPSRVREHLELLKPSLPVVAGFGIKTPDNVREFAKIPALSGVVVGSALIKTIRESRDKTSPDEPLMRQMASYADALNPSS